MTLITFIRSEMDSDDMDDSDKLTQLYKRATAEEKRILDDAFAMLCGWSLKTCITEAKKARKREDDLG